MNLNDKIKKQELIVETLNDDIDEVLNESIASWLADTAWEGLKLYVGGPVRYLTKKVLFNQLDDVLGDKEKEIEDKEKEIEDKDFPDEKKEEIQKEIDDLNKEIEELRLSIKNMKRDLNSGDTNSKYKQIVVRFDGTYDLDIEKLKSPIYKQKLSGEKYFTILSHNESNKTFDLKMKSMSGGSKWPSDVKVRLEYKDLSEYRQNNVDAQLVLNKFNSEDHGVEGEKVSVQYEIIKLIEKK